MKRSAALASGEAASGGGARGAATGTVRRRGGEVRCR